MTNNDDIDKHEYSGYGIGFDRRGFFSHPSGGTVRSVIIFRVNMSSSKILSTEKKKIF